MNIAGGLYEALVHKRNDSPELRACMENAVTSLLANSTTIDRPGMLLGRIQSGKTRAFIGIIALAFDNGYDMAIVLTKGTRVLAQQTYQRLKSDLAEPLENDDIQLYDIMHVPENLPTYVLNKKIVMVVKKETNNLDRVITALVDTYPNLGAKQLLFVDDEADFASVGFNRAEDLVELRKVAGQIDELRKKVNAYGYLQVTATPYSLYLQPENLEIKQTHQEFKPIKPAFTILLPTYPGYVGGDFYFEESAVPGSVASKVFVEITPDELEILRKSDRRSFKLEDVLVSPRVSILRQAVITFIVGASVRRVQQRLSKNREKKYSFVVHTEASKKAHQWQEDIVANLVDDLTDAVSTRPDLVRKLVSQAYADLAESVTVTAHGTPIPAEAEIQTEVVQALKKGYVIITKVNSEKEVEQLLDDKGQLKLVTPLNVFIGGQILDRGITIENLIGFYYGRRPYRFQQDTVLQHSRMYGNRSPEDLSVTRFCTSRVIYEAMRRINEFDKALREAFEKGGNDAGVVFICADPSNRVIPCSPNKILLSSTTTVTPFKRMLPVGFQTDSKTSARDAMKELDGIISGLTQGRKDGEPFLADCQVCKLILDKIAGMLIFEEGHQWDVKATKACIQYLSEAATGPTLVGRLWCMVFTGRNVIRVKQDGMFNDAPESGKDEGALARRLATEIPALILFKQDGEKDKGWAGSPFWWPLIIAPQNTRPVVFASDVV